MERRRSYDLGYVAGLREARRILVESAGCREFGRHELGAFVDELERLRRENPYILKRGRVYVFPLGRDGDNDFDPLTDADAFTGATVCPGTVSIGYEYEGAGKLLCCRPELPIVRARHEYEGEKGWRELMNELERRSKSSRYVVKALVDNRAAYDFPCTDFGIRRLDAKLADGFDYADIIGKWLLARLEYEGRTVAFRAYLGS